MAPSVHEVHEALAELVAPGEVTQEGMAFFGSIVLTLALSQRERGLLQTFRSNPQSPVPSLRLLAPYRPIETAMSSRPSRFIFL
jgi:hypothetical protein